MVYQFGKVGSTTIQKTLEDAGYGVINLHTMYFGHTSLFYFGGRKKNLLRRNLAISLIRLVLRFRKKTFWVTLTRNPVDRNVSAIFQDLSKHLARIDSRSADIDIIEQLSSWVNDPVYISTALTWFHREAERFFGVEILQRLHPEYGHVVLSTKRGPLLVMDFNALADLDTVLSEFLGGEFSTVTANKSARKWYSDLQTRFQKEYVPSQEALKLYTDSDLYKLYAPGSSE